MESRPNPTAAAPAAAPGKDTDPGSALPAGPARAAGGTGICSTATIGTRIISRSGAGSTSGIGTGTETGTGTTETGIWQEVVFNGLVSPHLDQDAVPEAALPHPGPFPTTPSPLRAGPLPAPRGLGNPPTAAAASRGHPAPLRGHSDPKRNGAFTPWREVCEPFPARGGGDGGDGALPVQLGGLEMHSSQSRDQEPCAILWIAWGYSCPHRPGGTLCHAPPLPARPPGAGKKGLELGRGSPSPLSRHSPQQHSHPNGNSSLSRRAFLVLEEAEEAGQAVTPSCPLGIPSRERKSPGGSG